jgi:signal transduction histidine kinase
MAPTKIPLLKNYRFEFKHLLVLLLVIVTFQIIVSYIHKTSLENLLYNTQDWYQLDSAERLANITATSLELLLETTISQHTIKDAKEIIQAFNIILSQQTLEHDVQDICLMVDDGKHINVIDNGKVLYSYFYTNDPVIPKPEKERSEYLTLYNQYRKSLISTERTISIQDGDQTFHVLVPFVPKGEYAGALYIKNTPDFSIITQEIIASYNEVTIIFASLIFLGLLAMFYISSFTVKERDEAQDLLLEETEKRVKDQIHHQKESQFTHRIYHTHHKAEKIMGFIKEDLYQLKPENIEEIKYRVEKYANFISRVIYDMKWYDPPVQSIRNTIFQTDLNEVIQFIVKHIFNRVSDKKNNYQFELDFDSELPVIKINEFVVWEIIEPLIQNSIDHSQNNQRIVIKIKTSYDQTSNTSLLSISDNGNGIPEDLMQLNENGTKKIFLEHSTTKTSMNNSGYGCYIAHEISTQRCNWKIDVSNMAGGGCQFILEIPN